jgi:hypothetical protein
MIGKGPMKKFGINCQRLSEILDLHLSFFNWKIRDECSSPLEIAQRVSWYPNWQLKNKDA